MKSSKTVVPQNQKMKSQKIIEMNGDAIKLLEKGRYQEAVISFKAVFKASIVEKITSLNVDSRPSNNGILEWTEHVLHADCGNRSYVYSRALTIKGPGEEGERSNDNGAIFIAVLYNFALSLHMYALQMEESGLSFKKKAIQLYLQTLSFIPLSTPDSMIEFVVLHNLGLAYHDIGVYEETQACFERIQSHSSQGHRFVHNILPKEDLQAVLVNVTYLKEPEIAACA